MDEGVILQVEVPFLGQVSRVGSRGTFETLLGGMASVSVRTVAATEAPKTIEARWPAEGVPPEMHWRSFEGALWRPVVGPEGKALDASGSFQAALARMTGPKQDKSRSRPDWDDYPFLLHRPGKTYHRWESFDSWKEDSPDLRIKSTLKEEAVVRAQARAADDLLMVDGVLHVRSQPPVWAVGYVQNAWIEPGKVRLAVPDLERHWGWLASFPLDRYEDALEFARTCVEKVRADERHVRVGYPAVRDVFEDGATTMYDEAAFPDTRAEDIRLVFESVEHDLRNAELHQLGRAFLKAYGDLGAAVDDLPEPGALAQAEASISALVEAADPNWETTWQNADTCVERLRTLSWRHEMEARLGMEADADAFAEPGP